MQTLQVQPLCLGIENPACAKLKVAGGSFGLSDPGFELSQDTHFGADSLFGTMQTLQVQPLCLGMEKPACAKLKGAGGSFGLSDPGFELSQDTHFEADSLFGTMQTLQVQPVCLGTE